MPHARQPQASYFAAEVEAYPIVDDPKRYSSIIDLKFYLHVLGLAVRNDVVQCFLSDTI